MSPPLICCLSVSHTERTLKVYLVSQRLEYLQSVETFEQRGLIDFSFFRTPEASGFYGQTVIVLQCSKSLRKVKVSAAVPEILMTFSSHVHMFIFNKVIPCLQRLF